MQSSTFNPDTFATDLRDYLAGALPGCRLAIGQKSSHLQPLVLLETNHLVAAFGCANGDPTGNYETLYQEFKTAFKSARQTWENLDLNFVFCVQPQTDDLEKFCSRIETDVYFCRKFVVPLNGPLGDTLSRLPFLPLTPLSGQSLRPPNAQSFLVQCGLSGSFAKDIVVQGESGVETIIDNCLAGVYGVAFDPTHSRTAPANAVIEPSDSVSLKSIEIKNFRAYRGMQSFEIGKKVTLLYGPNGFGKTSFFDAIDFGATGDIGRLSISENQFSKVARHLDAQEEPSQVSLNFTTNSTERRITRSVENRKFASLDSRSGDRKSILAELTGRDILQSDRVENFINLFRATHLFNQEDPELVKNFRDDCRLDPQIVSRMLAHQDYVNALSKVERIIGEIENKLKHRDADIFALSEQLVPQRQELARLSLDTSSGSDQQLLGQQLKELETKLAELQIPPIELPNATPHNLLRHWRAIIEARLGQVRNRLEQLSELLKDLHPLAKSKLELEQNRIQLTEKEKTLAVAENSKLETEEAQKLAEKSIAEIANLLATGQARAVAFQWHKANRPLYLQLLSKQLTLTTELSECSKLAEKTRASEESAATELRKVESQEKQLSTQFDLRQGTWKQMKALSDAISPWQQNQKQVEEYVRQEAGIKKTLEDLKTSENQYAEILSKEQVSEKELFRQIADSDKSQSELNILLRNLQGHILNGTCPVCGDDHGSKSELIKKIERHTQNDPIAPLRAALVTARDRIKKLEDDLANAKQQQKTLGEQLLVIVGQKSLLSDAIQGFLTSAVKLTGLPASEIAKIPESVSSELSKIQQGLDDLSRELKAATEAVSASKRKVAEIKEQLSKILSDEAAKKATLMRTNGELEAFRNDPAWKIIALEVTDAERELDEQKVSGSLDGLRSDYASRQNQIPKIIDSAAKARQDFLSQREVANSLRTQVNQLNKTVAQISSKFDQAKVPSDIAESELLDLIATESKLQSQLDALRNDASNLELALDAATTAAALTTIQSSIKSKEKELAKITLERDAFKPWGSFFSKLHRLLSHQQNSAIESFTDEYGPRTSVIQRRLRSVYGFDDVEIHTRDAAIHVRVLRNGTELRPTDYFSQSQQQTLLLGLFLTTCISQTWSGFAPIFMDDPVTHFDDLNTYAFLDLIVGLLEADSKERQFIISTCDEKLLQLARQKFRHFGQDAVFYRFEAIGAAGPVVRQIPNV